MRKTARLKRLNRSIFGGTDIGMIANEPVGKAQNNEVLISSQDHRSIVGAQECPRCCARRFAPGGDRDAVDRFRPILPKRRSYRIQFGRSSARDLFYRFNACAQVRLARGSGPDVTCNAFVIRYSQWQIRSLQFVDAEVRILRLQALDFVLP